MTMNYDKWRDGEGYDLAAIAELSAEEKERLTAVLLGRSPRDWRDIDALGALGTPGAEAAIHEALNDADPSIRQHAQRLAPDNVDEAQREKLLIHALLNTQIYGGLTQALDEAAEFHPPAVVEALLKGCMLPNSEGPVHFAALLYYIHGIAKEPFDWSHRPFFLKFGEPDLAKRKEAFLELCQKIKVDPQRYL